MRTVFPSTGANGSTERVMVLCKRNGNDGGGADEESGITER